jgi:hypothetical protein
VYARLVAGTGQFIAAEFHYLMALATFQSAVEAGNPRVLLSRQVSLCLYMSVEACTPVYARPRATHAYSSKAFVIRICPLQELGDLYVGMVGRKDSGGADAVLLSAAAEVSACLCENACVGIWRACVGLCIVTTNILWSLFLLVSDQIYESILTHGEREKDEHNPILDALLNPAPPPPPSSVARGKAICGSARDADMSSSALPSTQSLAAQQQQQEEGAEGRAGAKSLVSADAHASPATPQRAYASQSPTPPSVVTWFLPRNEAPKCAMLRGGGDIDEAVEEAVAIDQGKRVRNLCKHVRGKLMRLLVSAGWTQMIHECTCTLLLCIHD